MSRTLKEKVTAVFRKLPPEQQNSATQKKSFPKDEIPIGTAKKIAKKIGVGFRQLFKKNVK